MFRILNADLTPHAHLRFIKGKAQVKYLQVRDKRFAYDANSMCALELDPLLADQLKSQEGSQGFNGMIYSDRIPQHPCAHTDIQFLVLCVTRRCNLDCRYCFVSTLYDEASHDMVMDMDTETAKKAIKAIFDRVGAPRIRVGFFGGEPLLNKKLIHEIVPWAKGYAEERKKQIGFSCTTNATEMDVATARLFSDNDFSLIISMDGHEKIHDDWRPFKEGKAGSFQATVKGIETLAHAGYPMRRITLRGTYTGEGVDMMERVPYMIETFVDKGMAGHVSVEPSCLTESSCAGVPDTSTMAFKQDQLKPLFEKEYERLADYFVDRLRSGKSIPFHHLLVPMQRIFWGVHSPSECGAGKGYCDVSPEGDIYPCHREHGDPIGSIHNEGIDESLRVQWMDNRYYTRTTCPKCWMRNVCGGGCRMDSIISSGDLHTPDPITCWFKKQFLRNALWILSMVPHDRLMQLLPNPKKKRDGRFTPRPNQKPGQCQAPPQNRKPRIDEGGWF